MIVAVVGSPERNSVWALVRKDEVVPHAIVPVVKFLELVARKVERVALNLINCLEARMSPCVVELVEYLQSEVGIFLPCGQGVGIEANVKRSSKNFINE